MPPLQLAVTFVKSARKSDDSVTMNFVTQEEITTEKFTEIDAYRKVNGFLLFKANGAFDKHEIPTEDAQIKGQVSPSQYLRKCLFRKHMATGGTKETFPAYYDRAMAGFAQAVNDSYEDA